MSSARTRAISGCRRLGRPDLSNHVGAVSGLPPAPFDLASAAAELRTGSPRTARAHRDGFAVAAGAASEQPEGGVGG